MDISTVESAAVLYRINEAIIPNYFWRLIRCMYAHNSCESICGRFHPNNICKAEIWSYVHFIYCQHICSCSFRKQKCKGFAVTRSDRIVSGLPRGVEKLPID